MPTFTEAGAVLANVNYDLCPSVTLDVMVEEIERAVLYCHGNAREWGADPSRLFLVGHSAGAHLAASMLIDDWTKHDLPVGPIRGLVGLTGIYEPEVILRVSVNEEARIAPEVAARHDCLARPPRGGARVLLAAGGDEPRGWIDHPGLRRGVHVGRARRRVRHRRGRQPLLPARTRGDRRHAPQPVDPRPDPRLRRAHG